MKYSFVLPAYKARFFKEAIDSILAQTYNDFELIIVNDASPEDLDSIVKSYSDSRIRYYVNEENIGGKDLVAQWNHCLEYAKGEYVILASDDDVYSPIYLEKMDELVCKYPDVNVFRPRVQVIDESGIIKLTYCALEEMLDNVEYLYNLMLYNIGSGIPYFIFNRTALLNNGGFVNFPCAWGSDEATVIELANNGVVSHTDVLFSFRMSGDNISSLKNNKKQLYIKLKAYCYYEQWLKRKVEKLHNIYRNRKSELVLRYFNQYMKRNTVCVLNDSTIIAILFNLRNIFKLECCSLPWGVYMIIRLIIRRILVLARIIK